ncbi:endonuclease VII domain-containing protein [Pseudomonadales bacterium]|nr:endonuclease VII domain-containing protein [Pseudomonadales bacterium]
MKSDDIRTWPSTQAEAQEKSSRYFYTGISCRHGHRAKRYSSGKGGCVECARLRSLRWRGVNPTQQKAFNARRKSPEFRQKVNKLNREKYESDANYKLKLRERKLTKEYGLTLLDYDALLAGQKGVCAICGIAPNNSTKNLKLFAVDHSHETGEVRGILCDPCNLVIGKFEDDQKLLRAAARYLNRSKDWRAMFSGSGTK